MDAALLTAHENIDFLIVNHAFDALLTEIEYEDTKTKPVNSQHKAAVKPDELEYVEWEGLTERHN